jgi:hypothetical protein
MDPSMDDWKAIFAGVSAIAAAVSAVVAVLAAKATARRNNLAQQLAERHRQADLEARQDSLRRKLEAALIQLHMEMSTTFNNIRNTANQNPRPPTTGTRLRLDLYYAQRLFDLEPDLEVLPDAEKTIVQTAIEKTREYHSYITTAVPDMGQDPFNVPAFGGLVGPPLSIAYSAVKEAINHYRPDLKIADL